MRAKISMMPVNMTGYPVVRKTAQHAPALAELEFAMHRLSSKQGESWSWFVLLGVGLTVELLFFRRVGKRSWRGDKAIR